MVDAAAVVVVAVAVLAAAAVAVAAWCGVIREELSLLSSLGAANTSMRAMKDTTEMR